MKFPFFGNKGNCKNEGGQQNEHSIVPVENVELDPIEDDDASYLSLYEHVTLEASVIGCEAYIDAMIPMAAKVADAAGQWNQAIVRFPEGAGWNDLLNRKTPGWEEWKQLGILKDGKFQPQAAIKQAKLQPVAVANLALQGAAIVVGQAYMAEISKQLEGIESGIAAIQQEMRLEREAKVEARFEKLKEYLTIYGEVSTNPEKRQAVLNGIEVICLDALEAWKFQVKAMQDLGRVLAKSKRMKDDEVRAKLIEFQNRERDAQVAFKLYVAAERVSMQYDGDFCTARIAREQEKVEGCLEEYAVARGKAQELINEKIKHVKGGFVTLPAAKKDGYESRNLVFDAAHTVALNASRITPFALRDEAKRQAEKQRKRFYQATGADDPVAMLGSDRASELDKMDFIYNRADAMLIDEIGVHFVRTRPNGENLDNMDDIGLDSDRVD